MQRGSIVRSPATIWPRTYRQRSGQQRLLRFAFSPWSRACEEGCRRKKKDDKVSAIRVIEDWDGETCPLFHLAACISRLRRWIGRGGAALSLSNSEQSRRSQQGMMVTCMYTFVVIHWGEGYSYSVSILHQAGWLGRRGRCVMARSVSQASPYNIC